MRAVSRGEGKGWWALVGSLVCALCFLAMSCSERVNECLIKVERKQTELRESLKEVENPGFKSFRENEVRPSGEYPCSRHG